MKAENFLRLPEVKAKTGRGQSQIYDDMAVGKFPKPVKIGGRAVAWRETEIAEWQQSCIAKRDQTTSP